MGRWPPWWHFQCLGFRYERIWAAGSVLGKRATCPYSCNSRWVIMQVIHLIWASLYTRSFDTKSDQRYPRILLRDLVPKTLSRFFISLVSVHVSHPYSKTGRTNDLKTLIFVPLHKYLQRHTPLSSEFISLQACLHQTRVAKDYIILYFVILPLLLWSTSNTCCYNVVT